MSSYACTPVSGPLDAVVTVPGSKSVTNRALIAAALADGDSLLSNVLLADDTRLMIDALRTLGFAITVDEGDSVTEVTGCRGHLPACEGELFCGNSGTTMRFCTALAALGHGRFLLDGIERMRERPIGELAEVLQTLGTGIEYLGTDGYPPIAVHATGLSGGHVAFRSPRSSQMVSALLLAAPYAARDLLIDVTGEVTSASYLRMTTAVMDMFGVCVIEQYQAKGAKFIVEAPQRYRGSTVTIEPDASNAAYFLAAPAVAGGRVTVSGLKVDSIQGDARFVDVLERMGCQVGPSDAGLTVERPDPAEPLRGVDVDLNDMPDTVQTLAVLALFADGPTIIRNVASLRLKETDRLAALARELGKLGADIEEKEDSIRIEPPERIRAAEIDTYNDHRMAMSFALAGLRCPGLVINNPDCCSKTFPDFFERLERLG
ncbi:MAG: 3-phosphoshikimate 1-carboxyvinyltransferase [Phycisphaerales bacterium]|nr:MAG: 3-phosphoshikimate 1-carboxyvinyltransferase [Phycisphaerales bacterium]